MHEIKPGLWHWSARHPKIGSEVSTYYLATERVILDPMLPAEGLDAFERLGRPEHAIMTNRHHDRDVWRLREAFGCEVHCVANGLHEIEGRGPATPFRFGDTLPGGVVVHEVDAICADETALHIPAQRALACADGVVHWHGAAELSFVPDRLMADPEDTKRRLREAYRALTDELDFDLLLLAHGRPVPDGRRALAEFAGSG